MHNLWNLLISLPLPYIFALTLQLPFSNTPYIPPFSKYLEHKDHMQLFFDLGVVAIMKKHELYI
jgi:hypothetical protein